MIPALCPGRTREGSSSSRLCNAGGGRSSIAQELAPPRHVAPSHPNASPAWQTLWETILGSLAAEAVNGEQIIIEGAGHHIQLDRPDVVVNTILMLQPTSP